ncbi:apelin [Narcine bancroftii]|uniref:apelin n=1 Tax=Narcine bancroftii TaxID=1343680 RepID=UPI003831B0A1
MNVKFHSLALFVLFVSLTLVAGGPVAILSEGSTLDESDIRTFVRKVSRRPSQRQVPLKKYRRFRPRLSHKGPMPF